MTKVMNVSLKSAYKEMVKWPSPREILCQKIASIWSCLIGRLIKRLFDKVNREISITAVDSIPTGTPFKTKEIADKLFAKHYTNCFYRIVEGAIRRHLRDSVEDAAIQRVCRTKEGRQQKISKQEVPQQARSHNLPVILESPAAAAAQLPGNPPSPPSSGILPVSPGGRGNAASGTTTHRNTPLSDAPAALATAMRVIISESSASPVSSSSSFRTARGSQKKAVTAPSSPSSPVDSDGGFYSAKSKIS